MLDKQFETWTTTARVFEDAFGIVAIVAHDTWESLSTIWQDDQARFVELLAEAVDRSDAKAWEGYLVLLTPGTPTGSQEQRIARDIRYDTSRVRKLVGTGHELKTISDVERLLVSLLPLPPAELAEVSGSVLESLPPLLEPQGVPAELTLRLIRAFEQQTSLLTALASEGTE
jgi:hypothetical protein